MTLVSIWEMIRSTGLTSYSLLFLSVTAGVMYKGKLSAPKRQAVLLFVHQTAGWLGFLIGLLHGLLLIIDDYLPFSPSEVFIPFTSDYKPFLTGLGTLSLYGMLLLLVSSDAMKKMSRKLWRAIHYLAIPAYLFAFVHGIAIGTDSGETWSMIFYTSTAVMLVAMMFVRRLLLPVKNSV